MSRKTATAKPLPEKKKPLYKVETVGRADYRPNAQGGGRQGIIGMTFFFNEISLTVILNRKKFSTVNYFFHIMNKR